MRRDDVGAHGAGVEGDPVFASAASRHIEHGAPLRAIDFAIADHQPYMTRGRGQMTHHDSLFAGLDQHLVLVDQVNAEGRRRAVGQREIIGA